MSSLRSLLVAVLLLFPLPVFAAWTKVGGLGTATSTASSGTLALTTTAALEKGNVGICIVGADEGGAGTGDGSTFNRINKVTDAVGNAWQKYEWCNMNTVSTADGACVGVFWTLARFTLASSSTITATFQSNITAKAMTCEEYTVTSTTGYTVTTTAGANGRSDDALNVGSLTVATGVSAAHLFIRGSACESNNTGYTADSDYVAFTANATANTGTSTTSMGARGESRIATESTSAASDPDYPSAGGTADCASAMIGLNEAACPGWLKTSLMTLGVQGCGN